MAWHEKDLPKVQRAKEAWEKNDVAEVARILKKHAEILRWEDGEDYWLDRAAAEGNLPMVQMLVGLGLSVNESLSGTEGPIQRAATKGHFEVVRWFLEHGATINFTVHGVERCLPLQAAACEGHLETVKLLLQHGAAINGSWHGMNALMNAVFYGQKEIVDYLRSVGARDLRETHPPDYADSRATLLKKMIRSRGPLSELSWSIPGDPEVTIHLIPANEEAAEHTLFTIGLSDHRLASGMDLCACSELKMLLPQEWPVTAEKLADAEWNWPLEWMKRIVQQLRNAPELPPPPVLFLNEGNPPAPITSGSSLCGFLCCPDSTGSRQMDDFRWVNTRLLFGIYPEEIDFLRVNGLDAFIDELAGKEITLATDPGRLNIGTP